MHSPTPATNTRLVVCGLLIGQIFMRMTATRWVIVMQAIAAVALLILLTSPMLLTSRDAPPEESSLSGSHPEIVFPVTSVVARRADLVQRLTTGGTLRAKQEVDVQSRVSGHVTGVSAFNGKFVRKGECLAVIDDREYLVALERARGRNSVAFAATGPGHCRRTCRVAAPSRALSPGFQP